IPGIFIVLQGFGINNSVVRYSSYHLSNGQPEAALSYTKEAMGFLWFTGIFFAALNYLLSWALPIFILRRPDLTPYGQIMSLGIFGTVVIQTVTFTSIGWGRVGVSALSQITQASAKLCLSTLLVVLGLGVEGAVDGHVASTIVAGILGTSLLLSSVRGL